MGPVLFPQRCLIEYLIISLIQVDYDTKAADLGIKRGDQILEVNGQSFENITGDQTSCRILILLFSRRELPPETNSMPR